MQSVLTSRPCNCSSEDICILTVIIAELELGNIQRHVFGADLVGSRPTMFVCQVRKLSPSSVHGPIVRERRLVGVIRRLFRLLRAHGPRARRALCFYLGLGFLHVRQVRRRYRGRRRCADGFRLRRRHGSGRDRRALQRQRRRVSNDRPWRRLVGGETGVRHLGRLHRVVQGERNTCRGRAVQGQMFDKADRDAVRISF
jgi:hypothetical protein